MDSLTDSSDLSLHRIGDEGLLLDAGRQRLYALNACATFIWRQLTSGCSPDQASRSLSEHYALSSASAASFVADALRQYETLGGEDAAAAHLTTGVTGDNARFPRSSRQHGPSAAEVVRTYRLLDNVFRLHFGTAGLFDAIHPLLEPLRVVAGIEGTKVIDLSIVPADAGVVVTADQQVIGEASDVATAAVAVRACLTQLAVANAGGFCVLHASALRRDGAALLLPGEAGSGKSTLAAGLAGRGLERRFEMLCDDTTLLLGDPPQVRSLPSGLCIKRGAYPVLEKRFAGLRSMPEWCRPDGQWARYLVPGRDLRWAPDDATSKVRWIIFPRYHPETGTALRPLARHEALARLLRGAYFLSGKLDAVNLDRFIAWIASIDCFDLPLASLESATALIDELCS